MSLFTGMYPRRHGLVRGTHRKKPGVATLAELLRQAGYRTAAFTENGFIIRNRGFDEGFDEYTENTGHRPLSAPGYVDLTFQQASDWLRGNRHSPFFLFVHTYQVHFPYTPPESYRGRFRADATPGPEDPNVRRARDDYDREISFVDDELRRLFATVDELGPAGQTVVIVLSDHGEEFNEHGGIQHGSSVFDEVLRIPLVFWGPGLIPQAGRVDMQVSLIDVAPTLLELAQVAPPDAMEGISLAAAILDGDALPERALFAEANGRSRLLANGQAQPWNPPLIAVRWSDKKLIVHRPKKGAKRRTEKYDLRQDPAETQPQPLSPAERQSAEALVDAYLVGAALPGDEDIEDSALRERLRALGYFE
jgi:arylsulfatase A-like enzyme